MAALVASLDTLVANPGLAQTLTPAERARLLVQVAGVLAALGTLPAEPPQPEPSDRLLTAEQAAQRTGLTIQQLKTRKLPFKRKLGHRTVMFSALGLERWMQRATR